jgi:glycosyltransferase 2 family protein
VLAAAVLVGLALYADVGDLGHALGDFRWAWFPGALALTALNYLIRFGRWQVYLGRLGIEVPPGRSLRIFAAGLSMTITPAKAGELLKSGLLLRAFGTPISRSAPIVLAERVTDGLGIVLLAAVGLVWAGSGGHWPLLAAGLVGAVAVALAVRAPLPPRLQAAREAAVELLGLRLIVAMSLVAAVSWFFECLAAQVCVRGLGLDVSLAETTVVFTVASLAGALSFLPGGLGVAEAGMAGLLVGLAPVARADAAAATVLIRLATLWFAVALGVAALVLESRRA